MAGLTAPDPWKNVSAVMISIFVFRGRVARPCDISTRGSMAALGGRKAVAKVFNRRLTGYAFAWTLNMLFSRDTVQLGIRSVPPDTSIRKVA